MTLRDEFGDIDIYLFDQLLRERITRGMRILDAGCGTGRNLVYMLRNGFDVWGVDEDPTAIARVTELASRLAPALPSGRFTTQSVEAMSFDAESMDVVISSAVLHFARDEAHWLAMLREMWRVLAPNGLLWARLATTVAQPDLVPLGGRWYRMPDGDTRFLVDHEMLIDQATALGATLVDPIKSSVVHGSRSMGTWVMRKSNAISPA
jgi:SAM-dependent methyltransferase